MPNTRVPLPSQSDEQGKKRRRSPSPTAAEYRTRHGGPAKSHGRDVYLPYNQTNLRKRDFEAYQTLFTEYLKVQKKLRIEHLGQRETQGRWKSFLGKWNRGELAEGWYDPEFRTRLESRSGGSNSNHRDGPKIRERIEPTSQGESARMTKASRGQSDQQDDVQTTTRGRWIDQSSKYKEEYDSESSDDEIGPALPVPPDSTQPLKHSGPSLPLPQDIQIRNEQIDDDKRMQKATLTFERKVDRRTEKERLEELVPRAAPGTRERQLEKKREKAASSRTFREQKSPGAEEVNDRDLMGDDGVDNLKARKHAQERQQNERQIRKNEMLAARAAERAERMAVHRAKEENTIATLKALAKQRFG